MCWKCGKAITETPPFSRSLRCSSCDSDIRSCKNCSFYSPGSWHDCTERVEDEVRDKERANFCDFFRLNPLFKQDTEGQEASSKKNSLDSARSAFDNLFS